MENNKQTPARSVKIGLESYEELTDLEIMELAIIDWKDRAKRNLTTAQTLYSAFTYLGEDCYRETWDSNCVLCEMFSCKDTEKPCCPMYGRWGNEVVTCLDFNSPYKNWCRANKTDKLTMATALLDRLKIVCAEMKDGGKKEIRIVPTPFQLFAYYKENGCFYNVLIRLDKVLDCQTEEEIDAKGKTFYYGWK